MNLNYFGKNAAIYGIGNITIRASSFFLIPLYTHHLSVEDYGRLETMFVTIQILLIFMGIGMSSSVIRFYKESENHPFQLSNILGSSLLLLVTSILFISIIFILVFGSFFKSVIQHNLANTYILLISISATTECLTRYLISIYRAQNKANKFMFISISNAFLIITFTIILLHLFEQGIMAAIIGRIMGYGITVTILTFNLINFASLKYSKEKASELFSFGFPLIFASLAWFIMDASDRYFIAHYVGMNEVGFYALGYKITFIVYAMVVMPFELAYSPFVFRHLNDPSLKKYMSEIFTILIYTLIIISYSIVLISRDIIGLVAPKEYYNAYLVTICIMPTALFSGIIYWASAQLHLVKKTHYLAIVILSMAFLNLFLNYYLIPIYGWIGAAFATNVSYLLASAIILLLGQINYPIQFDIHGLIKAVAFLLIFILTYLLTAELTFIKYYAINIIIILLALINCYINFFITKKNIKGNR